MIIGLVGKSCSGKNVVGDYMKTLGWKVLDLDVIGHDVLEKNKPEIERTLGTSDRRELRKIVFKNPEKLRLLESVLYPQIVDTVLKEENTNSIVVANGALLYRAGLDRLCRYIFYVDASYTTRLMRALSRDSISAEDFKMRDDAQNDVHYNDVKYHSELIILDNEIDCTKQLVEACKKIIQDQGIL